MPGGAGQHVPPGEPPGVGAGGAAGGASRLCARAARHANRLGGLPGGCCTAVLLLSRGGGRGRAPCPGCAAPHTPPCLPNGLPRPRPPRQMVSLLHLADITEEGVTFQSPTDGQRTMLTPEASIGVQNRLGADIIMALDDVVPSTAADPERCELAAGRWWGGGGGRPADGGRWQQQRLGCWSCSRLLARPSCSRVSLVRRDTGLRRPRFARLAGSTAASPRTPAPRSKTCLPSSRAGWMSGCAPSAWRASWRAAPRAMQ